MTEVDRDLGLVLLKRLWQRQLISEECYISACNSHFFDRDRFTLHTAPHGENLEGEDRGNAIH